MTRIFSQFATRGAAATREKWEAYVAASAWCASSSIATRSWREFGDTLPEEPAGEMRGGPAKGNEVFGDDFAPKTVALTFDDGPHPRYTEQVLALLRKYGIRERTFFELGTIIGDCLRQRRGEAIANRRGREEGTGSGAHHRESQLSHPVLTKLTEEQRTREIDRTSLLLGEGRGRNRVLSGLRTARAISRSCRQVTADGLRSVMWNIDSLDWADPIPESVAMRVLHELAQKQKGIVLFHDIHKQSVTRAIAGYRGIDAGRYYTFLAYDKGQVRANREAAG